MRSGDSNVGLKRERLRQVHFHSLKDKKLRELLTKVGLKADGNRGAMISRYKHLTLLDAAECDKESPRPRSQLVREVRGQACVRGGERA
ncbi:unnamed protein product [Discosporangium mesarthrocarpum]